MDDIRDFLFSVTVAYGYAVAVWPVLRMRGRTAGLFSVCSAVVVLCAPLLLPAGNVVSRAIAAFYCIELMFKMLDYSRQHRGPERSADRFVDYLRFLIPFPLLLVVFGQRDRRLPAAGLRHREILGVLFSAALFASGFVLVDVASGIEAVRSWFPLDHLVKAVIFVITIESLSRLLYGLERMAGFDTTPVIRSAFLSRTVAEFWCRYNTRVHSWFDYNVFRPASGRRAPAWGVLVSFFVSAVFHELMFGMATSRFDGYQFTFFMLQAPAVLVSRPMHRFAMRTGMVGKAAAHGTTIIWMVVTSIFFFHGMNRVFPFFYASKPWLP